MHVLWSNVGYFISIPANHKDDCPLLGRSFLVRRECHETSQTTLCNSRSMLVITIIIILIMRMKLHIDSAQCVREIDRCNKSTAYQIKYSGGLSLLDAKAHQSGTLLGRRQYLDIVTNTLYLSPWPKNPQSHRLTVFIN